MIPGAKITSSPSNRISFRNDFLKIFIFALAYFGAHRFAFLFPDSKNVIMLIWPAAGIGLAAFLLNPKRLWPALILAFYIAGITADVILSDGSLIAAIGTMTASMVESIGCAWFIIYVTKDFQYFTRTQEVLALLIGTLVINAISACIGAGTSVLIRGSIFSQSWLSWYISDSLGILLIAPFIVSWSTNIRDLITDLHSKKIYESTAFILVWSFFSYIIFFYASKNISMDFHPYMLVALLAWPAMRLGMRGITMALLILFFILIYSARIPNVLSPWGGIYTNTPQLLLQYQIFLIFLAFVGYLMSAFYSGFKQAEGSLRKSEEQYRTIIETAMDGFWIVDTNGNILQVNDAYCSMTGYSKNELLNMHISDLETNENQEDVNKHIKRIKFFGEDRFEARHRRKDGSFIDFIANVQYRKEDGGKLIAFYHDVTERKNAELALIDNERLLRETQAIASLGSYILNINSGLWQSSEILDDIFGIDDKYIRSIEGWTQLIHPEWRDLMADYFSSHVIGERAGFDKEYKIVRHSDGEERWVYGLGKLEYDSEDRPIKMIGTISDITWRKRIEEELNNKLEELMKFQKLTVGRELNMIELKKEVNELLKMSGKEEKYKIIS